MKDQTKILMIVTAASTTEASDIGKMLVKERLAACCSIVQNVQSIYWWEGEITEDAEVMLLIKSIKAAEKAIIETIKKMHSYEVPEMITIDLAGGYDKYFKWIDESVSIS